MVSDDNDRVDALDDLTAEQLDARLNRKLEPYTGPGASSWGTGAAGAYQLGVIFGKQDALAEVREHLWSLIEEYAQWAAIDPPGEGEDRQPVDDWRDKARRELRRALGFAVD